MLPRARADDVLPAPSSQLPARRFVVAAAFGLLLGGFAAAQQLTPQIRYSTHDWTLPTNDLNFPEGWADVKAPGDGRQYALGTIEVHEVRSAPPSPPPYSRFSSALALPSAGNGFNFPLPSQVRQVAMLQVTEEDATQSIVLQRYFYGTGRNGEATEATNARAVSVWPAADPLDTRVVICGETFDETLPLSQDPLGWAMSNNSASGFIAVYDGNLTLLWTHHLFGVRPFQECAVTDISVRVDYANGFPVRDVITYCGISTHGSPVVGGNAWLTPVRPFLAAASALCPNAASGDTDNGPGQWDGFVGQISRDHANTGPTTINFHSVVGGSGQDGLFGICELDGNSADTPSRRFVVAGSTALGQPLMPSTNGANVFPATGLQCPSAPATDVYCLGTVQIFDDTGTPANLLLVSSGLIGSINDGNKTFARDVHARAAVTDFPSSPSSNLDDVIFVVGSTTDASLLSLSGLPPAEPFIAGVDGFMQVFGQDQAGSPLMVAHFTTYRGGPGNDGCTGVNAWNEYPEGVVATGYRGDVTSGLNDIDIASYVIYSGGFNPLNDFSLRPMRSGQVGGDGEDHPTAMGAKTATNNFANNSVYLDFGLGNPAGGGIAQGSNGRVNIVGMTTSVTIPYPTVGGGRPRSISATSPQTPDAVRTVLDLLPIGAGRTDGTGPVPPAPGLPFPRPNTNGGTTPPCALSPFGAQLGRPTPSANRLLIDYEGPPPAPGNTAGIVVVRSPGTTGLVIAALQVAFPGDLTGNPLMLPDGVEIWTWNPLFVLFYPPWQSKPFRDEIPLPISPLHATFTVQVAFGLISPIPAGNGANIPCQGTTSFLASPALWVSY